MARTIVTNEMIIEINELYLRIGTYAGVSRAMGGTPSAGTIKKYIIPNYQPQAQIQKKQITLADTVKPQLSYNDLGELCALSATEKIEIEELWKEILV